MMLRREREDGFNEGKLEGIKERNYSIAKTLKQMNMDNGSISKATGLTIDEIKNSKTLNKEKKQKISSPNFRQATQYKNIK